MRDAFRSDDDGAAVGLEQVAVDGKVVCVSPRFAMSAVAGDLSAGIMSALEKLSS